MNNFLAKQSNSYIVNFYTNEFTIILVRILSLLKIDIEFPVEMEELISSIPEEADWLDMCNLMYGMLTEDTVSIKSNINELEKIYNNLIDVEKKMKNPI